jgi:Zinc carboxypeptidase
MRGVVRACRGVSVAALFGLAVSEAAGQERPRTSPPGGCRSEMDARLAFGLCPDSTFDFYATGSYRAGVPRPDSVLGYPLGSWHTTYGRMERYLSALAAAVPERVRVFDYGRSIEQQTMHLVALGSEENIGRLDAIRSGLARLADPRVTSQSDADALIADLPVVVWLNAANDGNETAAFEAAMQVAYQVAAGEDERTQAMRRDALVLINLAHNPESHERMVAWYNAFVMGDPDPAAMEHSAPWGMSTNNNHYQFDLNRDALGLTQTETRAVAAELQRWRPQVFVDLHGETTQYFFPPAADPVSPVYPPSLERWLDVFGRANANAFDQYGWSYYTRDVFDLYYPGYWDTYPALHGATGMTYETDGGGQKGVRWRRDDGTILRFADGIARHFVASLATVEAAAQNREARLRDYYGFFVAGLEKGSSGGVRSVVLLPGRGTDRLATTLLRHGLELGRVTRAATVTATDYVTGERANRTIPEGAYVVDIAQPNGNLAHTLLAPDITLPATFARQELTKFVQNARRAPGEAEGYAFYDVTAWNLILAHGVPALWSATALTLEAERVGLPDGAAKAPGGWTGDVAVVRTGDSAPTLVGGASGRAQSAYVWRADDAGSIRLVAALMGEGFNVVVAERPLVVDGQDFPRGTYIARVERNAPALHERIDALARDAAVQVAAARSAFPERGPTGTGSETTRTLKAPRIAVLSGDGVGIGSYGALWFQLERRVGQPFTALRAQDVGGEPLARFDVVVMPDGGYGTLDDDAAETLASWVEAGGTLVAYGGAARWVQRNDFDIEYVAPDTTRLPADSVTAILARIDAALEDSVRVPLPPLTSPDARPGAATVVPGAFLRARLDPTHWLTTGYDAAELPLLVEALPLRASRGGANPVVFVGADRLVMAGFSWPDNTARTYAGKPYATVDGSGRGRVILFATDPLYRGVFDAAAGMLMNAIYLGAPGRADAER